MKKPSSFYALTISLCAAILFLNGILFYVFKCSDEYLQTTNVWGISSSIRRMDYLRQQQLLEALPDDPQSALTVVSDAETFLNPDNRVPKTKKILTITLPAEQSSKNRPSSPEDAVPTASPEPFPSFSQNSSDYENYVRLKQCILNVVRYEEYIAQIRDNAQNISAILSPIHANSWSVKNAFRCEKDYYGLGYLKLTPSLDDGINLILQYHVTDFLAVFLLLLLAFLLFWYLKEMPFAARGGRFPFLCTAALLGVGGCIGLYLTNFLIFYQTLGGPSLSVPLQSLESFFSCPYNLSLGAFLAFWIAAKLAVCLLFLSLGALLFTFRRPLPGIAFGSLLLLSQYALFRGLGEASPYLPLRELNLFSGFTFERFFNRYLNLNVGGLLLPRLPAFLILFTALLLGFGFWAFCKTKTLLARNSLALQQLYFDEIDNRYRETRRLWHDFNNHLLAVKALYSSGNVEEAKKYIDDLTSLGREALLPAKTGSRAVDLLLFQKYERALDLEQQIQFTIECNLKKHDFKDYDLCSLLGNLLDNAMEACQSLSDQTPRIALCIKETGNMLYVSCQNPYEGERVSENGQLPTTKKDRESHGIGLYSVRQICKKYIGTMEIETKDNIFLVSLLLSDRK